AVRAERVERSARREDVTSDPDRAVACAVRVDPSDGNALARYERGLFGRGIVAAHDGRRGMRARLPGLDGSVDPGGAALGDARSERRRIERRELDGGDRRSTAKAIELSLGGSAKVARHADGHVDAGEGLEEHFAGLSHVVTENRERALV